MLFGVTQEQMNLVEFVHDNHEKEFRHWAKDNESELMKWYDTNKTHGMFETAQKFAYYCASEFMKWKGNVEEA